MKTLYVLLLSADFRLGLKAFAVATALVLWVAGWYMFAINGRKWRLFVGIVMMFAVPIAIVLALVGRL